MHEAASQPAAGAADSVPRDYNFAADILHRNLAAGRAHKPAYIDPRGIWTYGQLAERVARFANVLRALGVRREERILICLTDTIDWPTAFLGAIKAGVVAVPVNTLLNANDYRFMLADSRAGVLVVSEELYPRFAGLVGSCPDLKHVIVSGTRSDSQGHGLPLLEDLLAGASGDDITAPTTRDDLCFWLYTSGSTGQPKGAVHVQASLRLTAELYAAPVLGLTENDLVYSVAKLFFAYGLGNAMTFPLAAGATTVLMPGRPTPEAVADLLRRHPVTALFGVPTFYAAFLASAAAPARPELQFAHLRIGRRSAAGRCRRGAGVGVTASTSSTGSARPRCCTFSCRTAAATCATAPPASRCRAMISASSATTAPWSSPANSANCRCAGRPRPRCIGTTGRSRAAPSSANGRARATNTSRTRTAITSTAAGATTC